jgi:hypothetical protein
VEDVRAGEIQILGGDGGGVADDGNGIIGEDVYSEWGARVGRSDLGVPN